MLTSALLPSLRAGAAASGAPSRIVNVSSMAHHRGGINFDDPNFEVAYDPVMIRLIIILLSDRPVPVSVEGIRPVEDS